MGLKLISAPADMPISLEEAKAHLREDVSDFDDQITGFIQAATAYCEGPRGFLGRALIDQTWQLTLDRFTHYEIKIPLPPLIEVVSVKYDDAAGEEQTLATTGYTVDTDQGDDFAWIVPVGCWPSTFCGINAVRIVFRCGYLDQTASPPVANVPATIKTAIKILVGTFYLNRENEVVGDSVASLPFAVEALLRPHRVHLSMA